MAQLPKHLIETPKMVNAAGAGQSAGDVLSDVLRAVRLTAAMQFCFMPAGTWQTDASPAFSAMAKGAGAKGAGGTIPFHIVVRGSCWLKIHDQEVALDEGDIVAFPFGTGHQLGAGIDGRLITPVKDLPPRPWRNLPVLKYGNEPSDLRLFCGYLECSAISFQPLRDSLPPMLHVRTRATENADWLLAAIAQIAAEVDRPRHGGLSMLERLSEITFIEVLRHHIISAQLGERGWLAALADPALARCIALIHAEPVRDWSLQVLASAAGLSRSTLAERFETMLGTSPIRYLRDWRLFLASVALRSTSKGISAIAAESGYGTEAAFNRAFARAFGMPPAAWRQSVR